MKSLACLFILAALLSPPQQQALTNEAITKLVKSGLSQDTIVSIVKTQPGTYALGADDIVALKNAGVPEGVIRAMVERNAPASAVGPANATARLVSDVGLYYKQGGEWVQLMPEVVNWKTGGVIKSHVTIGIVKGDVNGRIDGKHSANALTPPVEFLIYVPEGTEITEYQLLRLRQHSDTREFRTVSGGVFHQSSGAKRDLAPFNFKKVAERTFQVTLTADVLEPGEYGFLSPGAVMSSHASATLGKMYTFRVTE